MACRSKSDRKAIRQVVRLCRAAQVPALQYGVGDLDDASERALLEVCRTELVEVRALPGVARSIPREDGSSILYIAEGLEPEVRLFAILAHCARYWPSGKPGQHRSRGVAAGFALVGIFNLERSKGASAAAWAAYTRDALLSAPTLFAQTDYNRVVEWADAALCLLIGQRRAPPGDPVERMNRARELRLSGRLNESVGAYRAAYRMGLASGDYATAAECLVGAAMARASAGSLPDAQRFYARAVRFAEAHDLRDKRAMALHGLFALAVDYNNDELADLYADEAERAYAAASSPRLPSLTHDIGRYWIQGGDPDLGLGAVRIAERQFTRPRDKMVAWGNIALASGLLGRLMDYEYACCRVNVLALEADSALDLAACTLNMSVGAAGLGLMERARSYGMSALSMATEAKMHRLAFEVEAHLTAIGQGVRTRTEAPATRRAAREAIAGRIAKRAAAR